MIVTKRPTAGVFGLKSELQARTGVPMEWMKVMAKSKGLWKGVLKDTEDLTLLKLSGIAPPIQMLMMGSVTLPVELSIRALDWMGGIARHRRLLRQSLPSSV